MQKQENYVKVYELIFEKPTELNLSDLIIEIDKYIKNGQDASTFNGTFYIKSHQSLGSSELFLFGKDNPDASNHKRIIHKLEFEKVDIDESKEVLTDFIHFALSKKKHKRGKKEVHTLFVEKSSLIRAESIKRFIDHITGDSFLTTLQKRVINELYQSVKNASRIINMIQIKADVQPPLPSAQDDEIFEDIEVTEEIIYKPKKRGASIPLGLFDKVYSNFDLQDPTTKLHVKISDSNKNEVNIDFDMHNAPYSVKFELPLNKKEDDIQDDIATQINKLIDLYERGKI